MTSVFEAAEAFAAELTEIGVEVVSISRSVNRFWGRSAYIDLGGRHGRLRISDHGCNSDFRVAEESFDFEHLPSAREWLDGRMEAYARAAKAKALAERENREAEARRRSAEAALQSRHIACDRHIVAQGWATRAELAKMLAPERKALRQRARLELGL